MEENKEFMELLRQIRKSNRMQTIVCSILCIFAMIACTCCVMLFVRVYDMLPQLNVVFSQLEVVLANLEQTSQQLAAIDFQTMVQDVNALVVDAQMTLDQTMTSIDSIDFDSLNQAIGNLEAVVEPLAKLFNVFK